MALYNFVVIRVYYYYYYFAIDNIIDAQSNISTFIVIMHELSPHTHTHTHTHTHKKRKKESGCKKTKSNKTTTNKKKIIQELRNFFLEIITICC